MKIPLLLAEYVSDTGRPHFYTIVMAGIRAATLHPVIPALKLDLLVVTTFEGPDDVGDHDLRIRVRSEPNRVEALIFDGQVGSDDPFEVALSKVPLDLVLTPGSHWFEAILDDTLVYQMRFQLHPSPDDVTGT